MNDPIGSRDMELLCRQRATFDIQHSWKWLGEAEQWKDLAHRETASRFHAEHAGPMTMGPNTMQNDRRIMQQASQIEGKKTPLERQLSVISLARFPRSKSMRKINGTPISINYRQKRSILLRRKKSRDPKAVHSREVSVCDQLRAIPQWQFHRGALRAPFSGFFRSMMGSEIVVIQFRADWRCLPAKPHRAGVARNDDAVILISRLSTHQA
jgi:hypothetical protein